ncbi:hypothetical protein JCM8547_002305 [Rhodosporidiobolus lusitaniae]
MGDRSQKNWAQYQVDDLRSTVASIPPSKRPEALKTLVKAVPSFKCDWARPQLLHAGVKDGPGLGGEGGGVCVIDTTRLSVLESACGYFPFSYFPSSFVLRLLSATFSRDCHTHAPLVFITALTKFPQQTYLQLLNTIRDELQGKYDQKPQLSCSHELDVNLLALF